MASHVLAEYSYDDLYFANTDDLINNAVIIGDVPFVQLDELLKWKKAAAREKDLKDIVLIEKFLAKREG